jgi:hypothetical protein
MLSSSSSLFLVSNAAITKQNFQAAGYSVGTKTAAVNAKLATTWTVPAVTCNQGDSGIGLAIGIGHYYSSIEDSGVDLSVVCSGTTPQYSIAGYLGGAYTFLAVPVAAGDQIKFIGTLDASSGSVYYNIEDFTQKWDSVNSGFEPTSTTTSTHVEWSLSGSCYNPCVSPNPHFTSIKIGAGKITIGSHSGVIGSFISISSDKIYKWTLVEPLSGHVLAKATAITSTSTGFSIYWVASS